MTWASRAVKLRAVTTLFLASSRAARTRRAASIFCFTGALGALFFSSSALAKVRALPASLVASPTPRVSQRVSPPPGVENDGFARRARSIPLVAGPIGARAWVVMDADSGRVLAGRNIDQKMFPASTTKTMTALLAVESGRMERTFTIGPYPPLVGEASVFLQKGEKFVLRDLVKAAMMRSANDSCVAIAEAVSGSAQKFARRMNARAKVLGALNTHFVNPHGLHDPQHFTTARDLALIARRAMSLSEFADIAARREDQIHGNVKLGAVRPLLNRNRLLFRWNACDGVKTGYTRQAGHCLIASATRRAPDGKPWRLISVVMRSPDSWSDSYNALAHEGFEKFAPQVLARAGQEFSLPRADESVPAKLAREVRVPLRQGEQAQPRVVPERGGRPDVALKRGERVALIEWVAQGRVIARAPLLAARAAPAVAARASQSAPSDSALSSPDEGLRRALEQNRTLLVGVLLLGALAMGLMGLRAARPRA